MKSSQKILLSAFLACMTAGPLMGQPSQPPRVEKPEPHFNFDSRKIEEARRDAAAAKAASAKKSSSSKSRSAEIRALTFSDDSLRVNRPLIIKSGRTDAKVREQLKEDLLVMCRIIEKSAREHLSDVHKAAGIDLLALGGGNRSVRTVYLDDYGVIFTLNARIPLRNEAKAEELEEKETPLNEEWEETKNELFGQRRKARRLQASPLPAYDEEDVQDLKNELLDAMRNAANIRNLKPNDWITIAVSGPAQMERELFQVESRVEALAGGHPKVDVIAVDEQDGNDSTMILRAKKSDLDAVGKKTLSQEEMLAEMGKIVSVQVY
ncbi:MAG: hypothetical protein ACXW32_11440 [Limisphaerales bacterium]